MRLKTYLGAILAVALSLFSPLQGYADEQLQLKQAVCRPADGA